MAQIKSLQTGIKFKDTPIGKIPVDWEVATLESISNEIYRYPTYYNIKYVEQEKGVPEVRGELIKDNGKLSDNLSDYRFISKETSSQFPKTILREGDFVVSVRGTLGKIGYVSKNLEGSNMTANLIRVSPKHEQAYPLWLKQILLSDLFQKKLQGASSATTIKTITAPELKGLNVPLPPLSEQKKIAEILTTVDDAIEETDRIIEKTKELKKGLMQKLLIRGIGHKKFKKTEIGEIPVDWKVATLESISNEIYRYPTYYNIKYVEQEKGVPEVRGELIKDNGELSDNLSDYRFISKETSLLFPRTILHKGDFVVSVRGTLGKIGYVSAWLEGANMTANLIRVSPKHEQAYPLWLKQILLSDLFQKKLQNASSATTIKTITAPELKGLNIPLPPIFEQKKIAEILYEVDIEIENGENKKQSLESLKKSLMHILLTGIVRVKLH